MRKLRPDEPCWCGSEKLYRQCHAAFDKKLKRYEDKHIIVPRQDMIKTPEDIFKCKESAKINIAVLDYVEQHIKAGITTQEIDDMVYQVTTQMGGIPADLNYNGYPKSVCTSINEVVCHGIPSSDRILQEGDIVNVDCSTILDGYFSDSSRMFMIGDVGKEKEKLVNVTKESIELGLKAIKPWGYLGDIADAINKHAEANGYKVVRDIGGHGIGREFHEDPYVSYVIRRGTGMLLAPGLMFTIEPMINMGTAEVVTDYVDGWTVKTADGLPSAQWEVQVVITDEGYEIISY